MSSSSLSTKTAVVKVFEIPELLENILIHVPPKYLPLLRLVHPSFGKAITDLPVIKWLTFRHPGESTPLSIIRDPRLQHLLPHPKNPGILEIHPHINLILKKFYEELVPLVRHTFRRDGICPPKPAYFQTLPEDVWLTRPPIKILRVKTKTMKGNDVLYIEAPEGAAGISIKTFVTSLFLPITQRNRNNEDYWQDRQMHLMHYLGPENSEMEQLFVQRLSYYQGNIIPPDNIISREVQFYVKQGSSLTSRTTLLDQPNADSVNQGGEAVELDGDETAEWKMIFMVNSRSNLDIEADDVFYWYNDENMCPPRGFDISW
ncbi:hypothetical protein ABW20_dc0110630 [Dactylellina cionopaga]|nr:hypothetical protein ABW20_dc0110630 [Dactylellina cionopaga]